MDEYRRFLSLTLQRWERFFIVQNISPLVFKNDLVLYFEEFGPVERVRFIHNPEDGSFMRKALVLMRSRRSAARIMDKIHHRICTNEILGNEVGMDELVTTVKYRGRVKIYARGLYRLYLILRLPWTQNSEDDRTEMGLYLTREVVKAFRGLIVTNFQFFCDSHLGYYSGDVCLRFEHKSDKESALERAKDIPGVTSFISWRDAEDKDFWANILAEAGVSEKVEGDDILDVEGDEDGGNVDVEGDEDGGNVDGDEDGGNVDVGGDEDGGNVDVGGDEEGSSDSDGDW